MPPETIFSIAIVGSHNPAIHHPLWYGAKKLVAEEEAKAAAGPQLLCSGEITVFTIRELEIFCNREVWRVSTKSRYADAIKLAKDVFTHLDDTPTTKWGVNLDYAYGTNALKLLAAVDASSLLGKGPTTEVHTKTKTPLQGTHWARVVTGPDGLLFLNNFEYLSTAKGHFDLAPLLDNAVTEAEQLTKETKALIDARIKP